MRLLLRLGLSLASVVLVLALAELALRWRQQHDPIPGIQTLHVLTPGEPQLFGLAPGARSRSGKGVPYEVNAAGMRDRLYPLERRPGVRRIAVLGDSITFGLGVPLEDVYTERLEAALADGTEVLNFGVGGYNAYNERGLLEARVLDYRPDLVLVQFCINDLNDPTLHFDSQTRIALGEIPDDAYPNVLWKQDRRETSSRWLAGCRLQLCSLLPYGLVTSHDAGSRSFFLTQTPRARLERGVVSAWLRRQYDAMAAASRAAGAGFAVIAVPHQQQLVEPGLRGLQTDLVALGERAGWRVLDPLPAFLAARQRSDTALFIDIWHPSAAGHALIAAEIENALPSLGAGP